mmetsp:Transcript_36381/g.79331  ORF Transcript_36381/g.79331 Transcript_36381/m.79331 type:complete len:226 (+) Transcript_36381:785-1462(+)
MRTRARSSRSGTTTRSSQPYSAMRGAGGAWAWPGAAAGGRQPRILHTSSSRRLDISSTAAAAPGSGTILADAAPAAPAAPSSSCCMLPTPLEAPMAEPAMVATMSSVIWLRSESWLPAAFRALFSVSSFTDWRVDSQRYGSVGYIFCSRICVAWPSRDFPRALAVPFIRSWASEKLTRSIFGSRRNQWSHSSVARLESREAVKCASTWTESGVAFISEMTPCRRL